MQPGEHVLTSPRSEAGVAESRCFEAFQLKQFAHLDGIDRRLEALEETMNSRFDELRDRLAALSHSALRLEDDSHS